MSWGVPRRPKVSTKLGNPNPREGSDGDIQIKGTALGAKLWGKWSGRWWDIPLSRDGVTKFGVTDSNYLSIDRDSVDIFTNKVKVASFGATTTVKDINLTGKIIITSAGTRNVCIGTGNNDVSGSTDNIAIGVNAGNALESGSLYNILIGTGAGVLIDTGDANTCIGKDAAPVLSTGSANTCIGYLSGRVQDTGIGGLYIGHRAEASASNVNNEGVIAVGSVIAATPGRGTGTLVIGHESLSNIYMNRDGTAKVFCGIVKLKEIANSDSDVAGTGQLWVKNTTPCELWFTDDAGTDTKIV